MISLVSVAVALSFAFSRPKTPPQFPTPSSPATVVDSTANAVADDPPLDMETKQGPRDGFAWFDPTSKVGVVRYGWARGSYGSREISGTARNTSDVSYANVWINFNLEDASGAVVGNEVAGVDNLGPGKEWKFRTSVYEKKAVSATIVNIRISEH